MITLTPYQPKYRQSTLKRIEAFWGFHRDLVQKTEEQQPDEQERLMMQDYDAGFGKLDIKGPLAFCHFAG